MVDQEHLERIRKSVSAYLMKNHYDVPTELYLDDSTRNQIIDTATNIISTKWDAGYTSQGSFVQSFVNNELLQTISYADSTNIKCLSFYAMVIHNLKYVN
jgi:hypothetical protein